MTAYQLKGRLAGITPERAERMEVVIKAMSTRKMSIVDLAACLKLTKSGTRKYIKDLSQNGIIFPDGFMTGKTGASINRPLYSLTKDAEHVEWFLKAIMALDSDGLPRSRGQKATGGVHVMLDDEIFKVKRATWKIPQHEDLLAFFFGMRGVSA